MRRSEEIVEAAGKMQTASQSFDVAIEGFAELVASGDHEGADRLLDETFRQWQRHSADDPAWAESYSVE